MSREPLRENPLEPMSFTAQEVSVEGGRPVELYNISIGLERYYYTSAEDSFLFQGNTYVSRAIKRSSPEQSVEEGRGKLDLTMLADDPVCSRYIGVVPPTPMYVTLIRFHRDDPLDVRVLWTGRVVQAVFSNGAAICKLTAIASETLFSRQLPPYRYQALCNHFLYSPKCGLVPESFMFEGTVSDATGAQITVAGLTAAHSATWAVGGKVVVANDTRLVTAQSTDVLTLSMPFVSDPAGQPGAVYAGCSHSFLVCATKFANSARFGGFPTVPTTNPFVTGM